MQATAPAPSIVTRDNARSAEINEGRAAAIDFAPIPAAPVAAVPTAVIAADLTALFYALTV
jgi:hypothetical protein